jgi:uncharacterized membrane protein
MRAIVFLLALVLSGVAGAQQGKRHEGKQQMRQEDRQRMREDMNQVYRDRGRDGARPERQGRPMSPEQREKLRQDIRDANKQLKR